MRLPVLQRITIFPIKSLDGLEVPSALVLPSGAIQHDRRLALVDDGGNFVVGKTDPRLHHIRAEFALADWSVLLSYDGRIARFHMNADRSRLSEWLSEYLGRSIQVIENADRGYPDDSDAPGPTLMSTATLTEVASWYPGLSVEDARRRFRANLEISGVPAFWEDRLYGPIRRTKRFQVGRVCFDGVYPCQRCAVPGRDPQSGVVLADFQKIFHNRRRETLPAWVERSRFDHYYRLAVNTRLVGNGGTVAVGDEITLLESDRDAS